MSITRRLGSILLALALTPAAVACTATPTQTPTATSAAPTPTSTTLSPADQDLANAKEAVVNLWDVVDGLTNDPEASLQELDSVASGAALDFFRKNLTGYRLEQLTGSGSSLVEFESAERGKDTAEALPTWTITACVDTSGTKLVDPQGKNVTAPPYKFLHRSVVVERSGDLRVDQDEVLSTC